MAVKSDTLKKVEDLYDLQDASIRAILYKLETVQSEIGIIKSGKAHPIYAALNLEELLVKEALIKELISEIWQLNFGEDKNGRCG